jgi:glycosyltransferase involved in cell wall biosynthesis
MENLIIKMNEIIFSLITVTYNSEKTLGRTIESIRNQTLKNFEYIVIDGNSKDSTKKIIRNNKDVIDKWLSEDDRNMYDAINKGIRMSQGQIIGIVNSDDWLENDALEVIYSCAEKSNSSHLYVGNTRIFDPKDRSVKKDRRQKSALPLWLAMPFDHQSCFFRIQVYKELGLYDTSFPLVSDYDFILRFMRSRYTYSLIEGHTNNFMRGGMSSFRKSFKDIWRVLRKNGYGRFVSSMGIALRSLMKIILSARKKAGL